MKSIKFLVVILIIVMGSLNVNTYGQCSYNDGMVGYWPFNGDLADQTVNSNNGTAPAGAVYTTGVGGAANGAFQFNGTSRYITMPHHAAYNFGTGNFTYSCWLNLTPTGQHMYTFDKANGTNFGVQTYFLPSLYYVGSTSTPSSNTVTTAPLSSGVWHHLVFVRNGSALILYIDGAFNASYSYSVDNVNNSGAVYVGKNGAAGSGYYNGKMDNLRLYNRAITATEVSNLYNAELNNSACPYGVPTLSQWGLIGFAVMLLGAGAMVMRRRMVV